MTYRVTAVCLGNICRSPMAEAVLRARFDEAGLLGPVMVDSAGTAGWHEGGDADPRARRTLQQHGYPLQHRARQFHPSWFADVDLVLAMDRSNAEDLRALADRTGQQDAAIQLLRSFDPDADALEVPDPYYGGEQGFTEVLRMIEQASAGVVEHVRGDLRM